MLSLYSQLILFLLIKKNVPWHILAPRRGCLGNHLPLRRVRILAERFYRMETKFPIRQKRTVSQTVHIIFCNWLPFYRPFSFASQTFIWFADFLIIAFTCIQKPDFIIL